MNLTNKPVLIDAFNHLLMHAAGPLAKIERVSEGFLDTPEYIEDVMLYYRDGVIERFSIKEMDKTETFMAIVEAIARHG